MNCNTYGPVVKLKRKLRDGSVTCEYMREWNARVALVLIPDVEPDTASATIVYSELADDQVLHMARGEPEPEEATDMFDPEIFVH